MINQEINMIYLENQINHKYNNHNHLKKKNKKKKLFKKL